MRFPHGDRGDVVAEEIGEVGALGRARRDRQRGGDDALDAGEVERQHADLVPAAADRIVVVVMHGEADVVLHRAAALSRNNAWRGCRRGRRLRRPARSARRLSRSDGSRMASAVCSRRISLPACDSVPPLPAPGSRPISSFSRSSWNSTARGLSGSSAIRSTTVRRPDCTVYWRRWVMTLSPISSIMSSAPSGADFVGQHGRACGRCGSPAPAAGRSPGSASR